MKSERFWSASRAIRQVRSRSMRNSRLYPSSGPSEAEAGGLKPPNSLLKFIVKELKNFKIFLRGLQSALILFSFDGRFSNYGAFSNDLNGVVMKNFHSDIHLCLVSAPPLSMNVVPTGL